jgi:hypothetical protein
MNAGEFEWGPRDGPLFPGFAVKAGATHPGGRRFNLRRHVDVETR